MSVVVYLANTSIQILVGEPKKVPTIQRIYNLEMDEGIMLNGVVVSESGLIHLLKSAWEQYNLPTKDIELVVSGAQFITKVATLPKVKEKKAIDLVRREFTEIENQDAYIFDYAVVEENKKAGMMSAVCVAAFKEIVESYMDVFEGAGLTLSKISDALGCQIKAFNLVRDKTQKNYIVLNLDGTNLTSILFVDYQYNYFNRTRIFSEKGTEDFGIEIARTVSSILQFHASGGADEEITHVYMSGFKKAEFPKSKEQIELLGLTVHSISLNQVCQIPSDEHCYIEVESSYKDLVFCDYAHSIGEMVSISKDMNLVAKYDDYSSGKKEASKVRPFIPLIILFVVGVVLTTGLLGWNYMTQQQIEKAKAFVTEPENIGKSVQAQELEAIQADIQNQIASCQNARDVLNSYPKPNSTVAQKVTECAGDKVNITIESYESSTGAYVFIARAPVVTDIYNFISDLGATGIFADLEYSGYGYTEETKQYDIHVSGYLSESAGRQ